MSANSKPFGSVPSVLGEGFNAMGTSYHFTFGTNGQSAQNSNLFGKSSNPRFGNLGSAATCTTHFGTSGFGSNSAPGGLFGSKPFSTQSSSSFGSSAPTSFGTTTSCGKFGSSKTGIGQFGGFSFGSNPAPGRLFGSKPLLIQSSSPFGSSANTAFGTSNRGDFGSKTGIGRFGGFSFGSASPPPFFGTNSQSAQKPFPFGEIITPGFGSSGSTTAGFGSASAPVFGTNMRSAQNSFSSGRNAAAGFGSFGSTTPGFGSVSSPFVFGTNSQSTQSPFPFGRVITPAFGGSRSAMTGCASTIPTPGFTFGINSPLVQSSQPFGRSSNPGFGDTFGFTTTGTSHSGAPGGFGATPVGTTIKFNPSIGVDTMMRAGVSTNVSVRNQCITAMKEYENKSLEELRFEDYAACRKGGQTSVGIFDSTKPSQSTKQPSGPSVSVVFGNPVQSKSPSSATGDAISDLIKGMVTNLNLPADQKVVVFSIGTVIINKGPGGMDMMEESMSLNFDTQQKCITCMKECENKSFEEQQVEEDCAYNRRSLYPRSNFRGFSTTRRRALFAKRRGAANSFTLGNTTQWKPGANISATPKGTTVRFFAPTESEIVMKPSEATNIQIRYQCITCMKEYENKSLEELRTEDYAANRRGTQVPVINSGTPLKDMYSNEFELHYPEALIAEKRDEICNEEQLITNLNSLENGNRIDETIEELTKNMIVDETIEELTKNMIVDETIEELTKNMIVDETIEELTKNMIGSCNNMAEDAVQ